MQKAILTKGIIASGKSAYCEELLKKDKSYKRVNRDYIRHCLSGYQFDDENEILVQKVWKKIVKEILDSGYSIIVDEQNLNSLNRNKNIEYIKSIVPNIEIEIKNFSITLEEAIKRDSLRDFKIGEKVIRRTWNKYKNELIEMLEEKNKPKVEYDLNLPDCCIFDIDGTLAIRKNRNPYDFSKVKEDEINKSIKNLYFQLTENNNSRIFIFSGRDDSCYIDTIEWLRDNGIINFADLIMRKTGDKRKDADIKQEMYEKHIKGKYNVLYIVDDRKQVVDRWRELGLTVLDIAGNEF
jgi:predicted kinase